MSIGKLISATAMPQIGPITTGDLKKTKGSEPNSINEFGDLLASGVQKVDKAVKEFENLSTKFANGESVSIHELIIKGEQADISLRMMSTIKNKVLEAYTEIMHMQV